MSTTLKETKLCPSCGKTLPAGALAGLCPACLLAQGADTDAGGAGRFVPPPIEDIARLFPQLEVLGLLGAGGMGAVYKARQPALDRFVALKILPASGTGGANFAERFNREARALARLNHPNIVAVFEFGQAGGLHFFIMEFVDGANLRQLEQAGRLAPREALQIIPQICDALQYAHDEGVVHRDIKPENVLVDRKGRVKIADFGLAKILGQDAEASRLTAEGQVMGTPHYMAPEQIERPLTVDHRADIYALGVVLYEMLTGDLPLGKFSPPSRKVQVDVRLDEVVLRALENDPARRYQNASEVKSQVQTIAGSPAPAASARPAAKDSNRHKGFPLVVERNGARVVNWKAVFYWFGITFGFSTIIFGAVSVVTGRSLMGWLGIVGGMSVLVRLALSVVLVAWMVWAARRRKEPAPLPRTPEGTVILPPRKYSRKAILGAACIPLAGLVPLSLALAPAGQIESPGFLAATCLVLGFTAALASIVLGTVAIGEIRRSNHRISGLPLAVLAQMFFQLLFLDAVIISACLNGFGLFSRPLGEEIVRLFQAPTLDLFGALAICLPVNFFIVRRQWRMARSVNEPDQPDDKWTWSSAQIGTVIAIVCAMVLVMVAQRRMPPDGFGSTADQIAAPDPATGALVAQLPGGGAVELLAVAKADETPNQWWRPNGAPFTGATFEVAGLAEARVRDARRWNVAFRANDLPPGVESPISIRVKPDANVSSGGTLLDNGRPMRGGRSAQLAWTAPPPSATIRLGYGLEPWRTVVKHDMGTYSSAVDKRKGDPSWRSNLNHLTDDGADTQLTMVLGPASADWQMRVVAVDLDGVEHFPKQSTGTSLETSKTWTLTFGGLTRAQLKEIRTQARRVHWVEFRDVALQGKGAAKGNTEVRASAETWSPTLEPGKKPDLNAVRGEANEFTVRGEYEPALQRHIWLHNHTTEVDPSMSAVRRSFFLSDWAELARRYPKAKQALLEIRDLKTREFDQGRGNSDLFSDVNSINYYLQADQETVALFKRIHQKDPVLAARCIHHARDALVKGREYQLCLSYIPDVQKDFERIRWFWDHGTAMEKSRKDGKPFDRGVDRRFVTAVNQLIEILEGAGRKADAEEIRRQAAALVDAPEFKSSPAESINDAK